MTKFRIIEHKFFEFGKGNRGKTVITHEYPQDWSRGVEPYYPVNNEKNNGLFKQYRQYAATEAPNVVFGGRLGMYRYFNMDQVIATALEFVGKFNKEN